MFTRRQFLGTATMLGASVALSRYLPAWAMSASDGNLGLPSLTGNKFDLSIDSFPVMINGRHGHAVGVNGTLPAPLLRFREGEEIMLNVTNKLAEDTSIHWHGLLVPFEMDGVPGVTFPGIRPGETFQYKFAVPQNGTYWYHSHSGLQEQQGHYGPLIIEPKGKDPVAYDREYVLVLSDWSFMHPHKIFSKLKKMGHTMNYQQRTVPDFFDDAAKMGLGAAIDDRMMWGQMRMSPRDIADVTGETYTYLINGHGTKDNWNGVFKPGERVRMRIINASAMTIFNVRMPGLPMTIVQADGLHVKPLEVDEFQMGVAETYDVIIQPKEEKAYAFVAESIDRSGQVVATLGHMPGMRATEPKLRAVPTLTMKDMGMDHGAMGHENMNHGKMDHGGSAMGAMDHSGMNHSSMDHSNMAGMDHMMRDESMSSAKQIEKGPGVANVAMMPMSRLDEPGIGLENVPHRVLRYSQLRSLTRNPDLRKPERELELHLTSNMERYMWSFDGVKFSEVKEPITFREGERVRLTMINDTMMPHPIHLHGMFFELVNGGGDYAPRKHTVIVKPGEKLSVDISAEHVGDWAFHCHLLYHMHAGMMQVVSILPDKDKHKMHEKHREKMDHSQMDHGQMDHSGMDHGNMDHSQMGHGGMSHEDMNHDMMDHGSMNHGEGH